MDDKDCVGAFNTKHPPSKHAMRCLRRIGLMDEDGLPAQEINFTVRDKLLAFGYVESREAPSHKFYKTHKPGRTVDFLYVTELGCWELERQ